MEKTTDTMLVQATLGDVEKIVQRAMNEREQDLEKKVLDNIVVTFTDLAVELGTTITTLKKAKSLGYMEECVIVKGKGVMYDIDKARKGFAAYNNSKITRRMYA